MAQIIKKLCHRAWHPSLTPGSPGRRRGPTPTSCPLTLTCGSRIHGPITIICTREINQMPLPSLFQYKHVRVPIHPAFWIRNLLRSPSKSVIFWNYLVLLDIEMAFDFQQFVHPSFSIPRSLPSLRRARHERRVLLGLVCTVRPISSEPKTIHRWERHTEFCFTAERIWLYIFRLFIHLNSILLVLWGHL